MSRGLNFILLLGTWVLSAGCEQSTDTGISGIEDDAVLPGTETSKDFGDYVVHFNALGTDHLTADIARQYDIVRSQNRAMLTVSILEKQADGGQIAVSGGVSASAINLTGQLKNIAVREIREEDAIYYIGETAITNMETLIFTLHVTPIDEADRFTIRFQKQFFVD